MNIKIKCAAFVLVASLAVSAGVALASSGNSEDSVEKVTLSLEMAKKEDMPGNPHGTPPGQDKKKDKGGGGQGKGYSLFKGGVKLQSTPSQYYVNPTNSEGIPEEIVVSTVKASFETWDDNAGVNIHEGSLDYSAEYDGDRSVDVNEVSFGPIDGPGGTIAVTTFLYSNRTKEVVEYDIKLDSGENWGVFGTANYETSDYVDLQNMATHEAGHTLVLEDLYDSKYQEMTMYGYMTKEDEIYKGDLAWGDSDGVNELY